MNYFPFSSATLCVLFAFYAPALAQVDDAGWILARESDGIQVFTRPLNDGTVDDIKGVLTVAGNIDSAFKILSDIATLSSTDPVVVQTEIIRRVSEHEYYVWQLGKMPFFMNDRDIVSKIDFNKTANGGYILATKSYPGYIAEKPKLVRMREVEILVSLRPVSTTSFELQYKLHIGDTYSAFVTNASNKAALESTLERLKRMRNLTAANPIADK